MTDDLERRLAGGAPRPASLDVEQLRAELARRAAAGGLLDVAYATHDSPLGPLTVVVTPRGLLQLSYPGEPIEAQLDEIAARISPRILAAPERTDEVRRQLDEYFAGARRGFELPIDWRLVRGFAGASCAQRPGSPSATSRPTARWRPRQARRTPTGPPATPSARTRSRSWCHATASCMPAAAWGATPGASIGSASSSPSRACSPGTFRGFPTFEGQTTTSHRRSLTLTRTIPIFLLAILTAACTGPGGAVDTPRPDEAPILVIADGEPGDGPGLSVAEALTHGPTDDLVTVTGSLFVDADGTVRLCDAIAESFPPQCGGDRIVVTGLDPADVPELQEENGVRWAESATLFGSVE